MSSGTRLPADVVRLIFEAATVDDSRTARDYMTVSRVVNAWLHPVLYRIVVLRTEASVQLFERAIRQILRRSDTRTFRSVKHLAIYITSRQREREKAGLLGVDGLNSDARLRKRIACIAKACAGLHSVWCGGLPVGQVPVKWDSPCTSLSADAVEGSCVWDSVVSRLIWRTESSTPFYHWAQEPLALRFPQTLEYLLLEPSHLGRITSNAQRRAFLELTARPSFKRLVLVGAGWKYSLEEYASRSRAWLLDVPRTKFYLLQYTHPTKRSPYYEWPASIVIWLRYVQGRVDPFVGDTVVRYE